MRRGEEFDGDNAPHVFEHCRKPPCCAHAHGNVVFLIGRSRNRIDRVRHRHCLRFTRKRRSRDMQNHEVRMETGVRDKKHWQPARLRIGHLLRAALGDSRQRRDTTFMLEVLLQRYAYAKPLELKRMSSTREAILFLLDALVEAGSSAAFRMRDDFVTPISTD